MSFDQIVAGINENIEKKKEEEQQRIIPLETIFDDKPLKELINNIDSLEDKEVLELVRRHYSTILESIFMKEDKEFLKVFTNIRFLTMFIQHTSSKVLSHTDRVYCNKIAYDYLTGMNSKADEVLKGLFFNLSKHVNKDILPGLLGLGLDENISAYLALCRYSSMKEDINVKRVNYIIISSSKTIMDEQMIIFIYEKLFDSFTQLFKSTMFDPYSDEELSHISSCASEIYSNMSLAVIDILNGMPSVNIRKVLLSYANDYNVSRDLKIRFTIKSLNYYDYKRILDVIDLLEKEELIIVP